MCTDSFIFGSMTCCMSIFLSVSVLGGLVSFFVGSVTNTSPFFLSFQHCRSSHCSLIYTSWYVGMFFIPIFAFSLLTCMQSTCSVPQFDSEKNKYSPLLQSNKISGTWKWRKRSKTLGFMLVLLVSSVFFHLLLFYCLIWLLFYYRCCLLSQWLAVTNFSC